MRDEMAELGTESAEVGPKAAPIRARGGPGPDSRREVNPMAGEPEPIDPAEQLAAIGQAVITTDPTGVVIYWNRAAQELYGWTTAEAIGRNISSLTVPEVAHDVARDIMAALQGGIAWSGGFPVRRKDGTRFPALVTDAGIYRDGNLVGIIGVSTNLGSALRPLLERSTDAALVLRSDGMITYASPVVFRLFGWPDEAIIGSPITSLLHPDDRPELGRFLEELLIEPGEHPAVELRVRRGDGWVWVEVALTNLLDDPMIRGVVCNLRLSLRRHAQERAENRAEQLQTALQSRLIIEQAKGYLAGRDGMSVQEGFDRLRRYARDHQTGIQEVARGVVDGDLTGV